MSALEASGNVAPSYRPVRFPERQTLVERHVDGTLILRSARALPRIEQRSFADFIPLWSAQRGDTAAFRERDGAGAWPNVAACQRIAAELVSLDASALATHSRVVAELSRRLKQQKARGATLVIERLMLMTEPPSLDANEIADKGYVDQAITRTRRGHLIDALYQAEPASHVARIGASK
ncbi:hypothetical protein CR51_04820 [Caballeronia megalochromosomata]|jgi:hypothetical protein|nr:hypothetical protein CR51_04820 [Caballeronia megalochromosomata]